jgi:dihydrodipicolinate synthase/N-acetylneuraminate lyase
VLSDEEWQALTPDEREAMFRRAIRHAQGPVIVGPRDRQRTVGVSATKIAKRRRSSKTARAARKRNRAQ